MRWFNRIVVVVLIFAVFFGARWVVLSQIKPSFGYGIRAEFSEMPSDDKELEEWLDAQPGVVRVNIGRDTKTIRVYWIMTQDLWYDPPSPDPRQVFEQLGYKGMTNYNHNWRDD